MRSDSLSGVVRTDVLIDVSVLIAGAINIITYFPLYKCNALPIKNKIQESPK